jgi:hypothetical protein
VILGHLAIKVAAELWLNPTEKFRFPDILRAGLFPLEREQKVANICQKLPFSPLREIPEDTWIALCMKRKSWALAKVAQSFMSVFGKASFGYCCM